MDQPSFFADLLTGFAVSPHWLQVLWLVLVPPTVVGVAFCVTRAVRDVMLARRERHGTELGQMVCVVYKGADGRLMVYVEGAVREVPSLEDVFGKPLLRPARH
jgi:hypothetical protein